MKNKYLRLVVVLSALLLSVSSLWAERVTQEDAALVAANFLNAGDTTSQGAQAPGRNRPIRRVTLSEEAQYYVYANADGNGWVMVAANDVVQPILAYSDEGEFRADNQPANIKSWLGKYNKQIKQAEADGVQATEEVKQEWKQLRKGTGIRKGTPVVAALIQTKWDQDAPYYNQCPTKNDEHCLTGCVATAMAQVMNYWKWPEKGTGSYSYTTQTLGLSASADFGNTTYDWGNMLLKYNGYYPEGSSQWTTVSNATDAQKNAVATLMYHCGVAVKMEYNLSAAGGSGAQTIRPNASYTTEKCAQNALCQNFGYKSTTVKGYYRPGGYGYSQVSDANWHNLLKTELDAARPIMYAGGGYEDISDEDTYYGHSFICDGYDNTTPTRKYHFNWGWSGYCDGYYDIDNLVPGTGGSGAGQGEYLYDHDIIVGIIPDKPNITITWSVQGTETSKSYTYGSLWSPTTEPTDCSGGKKFVGWTELPSISGGTRPSDLFASGTKMVTETKKYYAVYATASSGGSSTPEKATSIAVGDEVILVYENGNTKKEMTGFSSTSTVYGTVDDYTTTPAGTYTFEVVAGNSTGTYALKHGTVYANWSSGNSLSSTSTLSDNSSWTIEFDNSGNATIANANTSSRTIRYNTGSPRFACYTSGQADVQLYKMGSGTTYSDYSLTCGAACSNTPSMSFTNSTVNKTTDDASYTQAVNITDKGSGQTVAYSSSDETIATVTNAGVVTLKGKVGSTTITASVEANDTYCAASASYTLNVTAAPINVTLYYNNTSTTINNQTSPYTLPTGLPYNAAMCGGDWTFAGWYNTTYAKSTTAPTYITQLDATGSAYAVYTTTETTSGAPVRKTAAPQGTTLWAEDFSGYSANDVPSGSTANSHTGTTVYNSGSVTYSVENGGSTTKVYNENNAGGTAPELLIAKSNGSFSIAGIPTGDATAMTFTFKTNQTSNLSVTSGTTGITVGSLSISSKTATCEITATAGVKTFDLTIKRTTGSNSREDDFLLVVKTAGSGGTTSTTYYATSPDCATPPPATDYTVTWVACGETFDSKGYASGAALTMPASTPSDNAGKVFVGWTATEHYTGDTAPADLFTSAGSKTVTADVTYYAVFQ